MKRKSSKNNIFLGKRKKTFKDNVTSNEKVQFLVNDKSNHSKTEKAKTKEVRAKPSSAKTVREITKSRVRGREKTRRPKTQPASKLKLPEKEIHKDRASTSGYSSLGFTYHAYFCILQIFFNWLKFCWIFVTFYSSHISRHEISFSPVPMEERVHSWLQE